MTIPQFIFLVVVIEVLIFLLAATSVFAHEPFLKTTLKQMLVFHIAWAILAFIVLFIVTIWNALG